MHAFVFGDPAVAVEILFFEFPDDAGIGIGNSFAAAGRRGGSEKLIAGLGFGSVGVFQLSADVAGLSNVNTENVAGTFAVGCDGWLEQDEVERISGLRRIELPAGLTFGTAQRLHRVGINPAPVNELQYLVYPWVVDCQVLRAAGWHPGWDNAAVLEALMEARAGHRAAGRRLPSKEVTITAAPWSSAYLIAGTEARMRVSSVTRASSTGTLRSARMNTRLPRRSTSDMRLYFMRLLR